VKQFVPVEKVYPSVVAAVAPAQRSAHIAADNAETTAIRRLPRSIHAQ
jgi:hypothetical protein